VILAPQKQTHFRKSLGKSQHNDDKFKCFWKSVQGLHYSSHAVWAGCPLI